MSGIVIEAENLTKDYGNNHGIFDVSLKVKKGEVFGFIGTNGSGKTTTIRSMMGFIQPDGGTAAIYGMDVWRDAVRIKPFVSYVPGEIAFPPLASGTAFLKAQAKYLGIHDFAYMNALIARFRLDPSAGLKRMSKGMKQKTALVAALMGDRDILILDEPTTGLDPLMREVFLELMREEKARGKTIFMSSHIFEEVEDVCDRAAMIKDGHILDVIDIYRLRHDARKHFYVTFQEHGDVLRFADVCTFAKCQAKGDLDCEIVIDRDNIMKLLRLLKGYKIIALSETHESLEDCFRKAFMKGGAGNAGRE